MKGDCRSLAGGWSASPCNKILKTNLKRKALSELLFQRPSHTVLCLEPVMTQSSQQCKHVLEEDSLLVETGKQRDKA